MKCNRQKLLATKQGCQTQEHEQQPAGLGLGVGRHGTQESNEQRQEGEQQEQEETLPNSSSNAGLELYSHSKKDDKKYRYISSHRGRTKTSHCAAQSNAISSTTRMPPASEPRPIQIRSQSESESESESESKSKSIISTVRACTLETPVPLTRNQQQQHRVRRRYPALQRADEKLPKMVGRLHRPVKEFAAHSSRKGVFKILVHWFQ